MRIRADIVADLLRDLPPSDVLDAGCGDGRVGAALLADGHRVTFLDPSPEMIALARSRVSAADAGRCQYVEETLESMPAGRRFDVVLCLGVLAHVGSIPDAVAALAAAARPGARVLIQITDADTAIGRLTARYAAWRERHWPVRRYVYNELGLDSLVSTAGDFGLSFEAVCRYSFIVPGMMRLLPNAVLYRMSTLSRRWPFRAIGGEAIVQFRRR